MVTHETQAVHSPHIGLYPVGDGVRALTIREEKLRAARAVLQVREQAAEAARDHRERERLHDRLDTLWARYVALEDARDAAFWLTVEHIEAGALLELEAAR